MKTAIAFGVWGVELGLSLALIPAALLALSFENEGNRGSLLPLHQALNLLALLLTALPFGVVLWVGYRRFLSSRPEVPLGLGLPLVAGLGCVLGALLALWLGGKLSHVGADAQARRTQDDIRQRAEAGEQEMFCSVMVTDPEATARDMQRCRAYLESVPQGMDRWLAFQRFLAGRVDLKTWNPQQVGLSPFPDKEVALAGVHHDQAWFLRHFFESMLASGQTLYYTDVSILTDVLKRLDPALGWSREAIESLRPEVFPALLERITPGADKSLDGAPEDLTQARELLTRLIESGPREVPPVPPLAAPPTAETVGVVRMGTDGALEFWMRATAAQGDLGDVYFRHAPGSESHRQWMNTLGPLDTGQVRPLTRWKAP